MILRVDFPAPVPPSTVHTQGVRDHHLRTAKRATPPSICSPLCVPERLEEPTTIRHPDSRSPISFPFLELSRANLLIVAIGRSAAMNDTAECQRGTLRQVVQRFPPNELSECANPRVMRYGCSRHSQDPSQSLRKRFDGLVRFLGSALTRGCRARRRRAREVVGDHVERDEMTTHRGSIVRALARAREPVLARNKSRCARASSGAAPRGDTVRAFATPASEVKIAAELGPQPRFFPYNARVCEERDVSWSANTQI